MISVAVILSLIFGVFSQQDISDVGAANKAIAQRLMSYYTPSVLGTIPEKISEEPDGFQWFEMGFFWMAKMQYSKITGDGTYFKTVGGALANASFGSSASFLGDPSLEAFSARTGKWNDDIIWWGIAAIIGAEIGGAGAKTPAGSTFLNIAMRTFDQTFVQWDGECGGGIYWSRFRDDPNRGRAVYKSTITNVEAIILGVSIYLVNNQKSYLDQSIQIYDWLMGPSGLVTADGIVYDGMRTTNCTDIVRVQHSYNAGLFLGGAALLYKATNNQKYISDAKIVANNFQTVFTRDNIIIDPCEVTGRCKRNQAQFKGVSIFSLCYVYEFSNDDSLKETFTRWITTSAAAMAKTCDSDWTCSNFWLPNATTLPRDVHNQINALFLANARSLIGNVKVEGVPLPPRVAADGSPQGTGASQNNQERLCATGILVGLILLVVIF